MRKIKIHPSFLILALFCAISGTAVKYAIVLLFVTLHEMAHCAAAIFFGAKLEEIWFTPIGERAAVKGLYFLAPWKRGLIYFAGPALNLVLALLFYFFCLKVPQFSFFAQINLAVGIFNLLPFFPLDGGRILFELLSGKIGFLRSGAYMTALSKWCSGILILIGFIQFFLFPYQISLFLIGLYLMDSNRKEYQKLAFDFYRHISTNGKMKKNSGRVYSVKSLYINGNTKLEEVVKRLTLDDFFQVYIWIDGTLFVLHHFQIVNMILHHGLQEEVGSFCSKGKALGEVYAGEKQKDAKNG